MEVKQMNFLEAVKAMKEGKKVKRKSLDRTIHKYFYLDLKMEDCAFYSSTNEIFAFDIVDIEATDWEIYEEKDTWNFADELTGILPKESEEYKRVIDLFKEYNQKVKEDVKKKYLDRREAVSSINNADVNIIIDKRAGGL